MGGHIDFVMCETNFWKISACHPAVINRPRGCLNDNVANTDCNYSLNVSLIQFMSYVFI